MPIEAFIIAIFGIFSIFIAMPLVINKRLAGAGKQRTAQPDGIPMKELERLVEQAAARAAEPVQQQLDRIEHRLEALEAASLPAHSAEATNLLGKGPAREEAAEAGPRTTGRLPA